MNDCSHVAYPNDEDADIEALSIDAGEDRVSFEHEIGDEVFPSRREKLGVLGAKVAELGVVNVTKPYTPHESAVKTMTAFPARNRRSIAA